MESVIAGGIEIGLKGMCFTDHMDLDYPGDECFDLDTVSYREKYLRMRSMTERFDPGFELYFGMELGLQPHLCEIHRQLVSENPFDFVIASLHLVDGYDPYYGEIFKVMSEKDAYRRYFESILENISVFDDFDVLGHLDYIVRYGPTKDEDYSYKEYADIIDAVLKKLIEMGKGIELNTGALRKGMKDPNPNSEIVKRYRELGGEIITIGSDAHRSIGVGYYFDKAFSILTEAGFDRYCIFKERKCEFIMI